MALVAAQQNGAPQGPKTATRAREGEVYETHKAPRSRNTPHPRERPGLLPEPGPQRSDRAVRRSSGDAPSLALPALAAESYEAIDSATLCFLVQRALDVKKEEEGP